MRIITAIKVFFKILFNGEFAQKIQNFLDTTPQTESVVLPNLNFEPGTVALLALLQREGRFIDFLQEDLENVPDAQVGAVVKSTVYKGCRRAFKDYIKLEAILEDDEETEVTVEDGFDPQEIRLVGKVEGEPPFKGTLHHKGWRLVKADLPSIGTEEEDGDVVCPAEVELL